MARLGVNTVRTYTVPPRWLLDAAAAEGLRVMVGLPWESHVAFLEERRTAADVTRRVRDGVAACAGHPAVLAYAVGNEIPPSIVRWHGARRVERHLVRLIDAARSADPGALITYANFPSTEYLRLDECDFVSFNVFLERREDFVRYLDRLHVLADDRPLVLTETGLDGIRAGEAAQAEAIGWQIRTALRSGCAGVVVFSWTDEWHRGGHDVTEWGFGVTGRDRREKPAAEAMREAFSEAPFPADRPWPPVSVVLCTHNGSRTLPAACEGLAALEYPDVEVIVVDDGSADGSGAIAEAFGFRVLRTANAGLSSARNTGTRAASADIVAFIDDDAVPDPLWLQYTVDALERGNYAGVGGPNLAPPGRTPAEDSVALAPGGPRHVLIDDRRAEHLPGCNMAFRRDALESVDGFDPRFRVAGDDVDLCWRVQQDGGELGFAPAAVVWHRRRDTVRGYVRQQRGYGRAEALLERKWPARFNALGHARWTGSVYGAARGLGRRRIRYGQWGLAPFQSSEAAPPALAAALSQTPEWYLLIALLVAAGGLGSLWAPLYLCLAFAAVAIGEALLTAWRAAGDAHRRAPAGSRAHRPLTALLHLLQPLARLAGRLEGGLTPWRRCGAGALAPAGRRVHVRWSETWHAPSRWVEAVETALAERRYAVLRGGPHDRWDLEARGGGLGAARLRAAVEEHGSGRQLVRCRIWPRLHSIARVGSAAGLAVAMAAVLTGTHVAGAAFAAAGIVIVAVGLLQAGSAARELGRAIDTTDPAYRPGGSLDASVGEESA